MTTTTRIAKTGPKKCSKELSDLPSTGLSFSCCVVVRWRGCTVHFLHRRSSATGVRVVGSVVGHVGHRSAVVCGIVGRHHGPTLAAFQTTPRVGAELAELLRLLGSLDGVCIALRSMLELGLPAHGRHARITIT